MTRIQTALGVQQGEGSEANRRGGFTLLELVLVMTLLVLVLTTSYRLVVDCLETERRLEKLTIPEKVAEGILSLFRRDLAGTYFRGMGRRIFLVTDGGVPPEAKDEIRFLSTVEPTPVQENVDRSTVGAVQFRTITGLGYYLRPNRLTENVEAYTLFRKEITQFDPVEPLDAPGMNYEVYNKVRYLSIECFDGWSWYPEWSSEARIQAEEDELLAAEEEGEGIRRVSEEQASRETLNAAPGVDPDALGSGLLPPAAVPVAVRIEIGLYVSPREKIERDSAGNPLVKSYSTIIPILTAQRIPIEELTEEGLTDAAGEGALDEGEGGGNRSSGLRGGIPGELLEGGAGGGRPGAARGLLGSFGGARSLRGGGGQAGPRRERAGFGGPGGQGGLRGTRPGAAGGAGRQGAGRAGGGRGPAGGRAPGGSGARR